MIFNCQGILYVLRFYFCHYRNRAFKFHYVHHFISFLYVMASPQCIIGDSTLIMILTIYYIYIYNSVYMYAVHISSHELRLLRTSPFTNYTYIPSTCTSKFMISRIATKQSVQVTLPLIL